MPTKITIPATELYDRETMQFTDSPEITLVLEHSLVSLSKWEARTGKAFLGPEAKTELETLMYIQDMCLDDEPPPLEIIRIIPRAEFEKINEYIDHKHTATWFSDEIKKGPSREVVTAELVYHWMIAMAVPVEVFERWHLSRLFTQLKLISEKNKPPKKYSKAETIARHRALNEKNRALMAGGGMK